MCKLSNGKTIFILLAILVIASFFRLWIINDFPGGFFPDEAANGTDALLILDGYHSPFFERGLGREALFFYMIAISIAFFGIGVWQIHIVSAIIGIVNVFITWLFSKKLFNTKVAVLATFFMATSAWHVTHSRTGFRAILVPLLSTLFFYFSYLVIKEASLKKRVVFSVLAGLSLGLGFYTYISFRAIVAIILVLAILILIVNRKLFKKYFKELLVGIAAAFLIMFPLIFYFIDHPGTFMGRAGCVSIFSEDLNQGDLIGTFLGVAKKTFGMFFTAGDLNWRHNVSGYSMLTPFISGFFVIGFIYSLWIVLWNLFKGRFFKKEYLGDYFKYFFLIVWFLGMLGPELMTAEGIPHGLRAMGAIPAVFIFAAIAIDFIYRKIRFFPKAKIYILLFSVIIIFVMFCNFIYDYSLYFGISVNSPEAYYAYRSDLTVVSEYLNNRNIKEKTYLVLDEYSVQTPDFLTAKNNQPYILLDPATSYQVQLNPGDQIVFTQSTIFDTKKFEEYHPEASLVVLKFNQFEEEIMRVYQYEK